MNQDFSKIIEDRENFKEKFQRLLVKIRDDLKGVDCCVGPPSHRAGQNSCDSPLALRASFFHMYHMRTKQYNIIGSAGYIPWRIHSFCDYGCQQYMLHSKSCNRRVGDKKCACPSSGFK